MGKDKLWKVIRVCTVNVLYAVYYGILCWRLKLILDIFPVFDEISTIIACIVLSISFVALHLIFSCLAIRKEKWNINRQTWCHIPMLLFIAFALGPYGMTLHHQYQAVNSALNNTKWRNTSSFIWVTTTETMGVDRGNVTSKLIENYNCFDLHIPRTDFYILQAALPLLVLTYILYPYPDRDYKAGEMFAIAIEFLNAFDILDLLEDIGCVQTYDTGWMVLFYIALIVSTLLLAFPAGLEDDDKNDPQGIRITSSILTLVFTDIMFSIIRICVMYKEDDVQTGFHFLIKNILAAVIRPCLIWYGIKQKRKAQREENKPRWEMRLERLN